MRDLQDDIVRIAALAAFSVAGFLVCLLAWGWWSDVRYENSMSTTFSDGVCNIAVVPIAGTIGMVGTLDYSENAETQTDADITVSMLRSAEYEPNILGVLLRIDSGGGSPVASTVIADAVAALNIPVASLIREFGTSGAYFVASASDTIIASPLSDVGSLGVTMSYLDYSAQHAGDGVSFVSLTSAPYKDYGTPDRPLTSEERALLERDLEIYHREFISQIARYRNMPLEKVAELADGASMPAGLGFEKGLVDELGNEETARAWFARELGLTADEIIFCN